MEKVSDIQARMQEALWQEGREQGRRFMTRWCQMVMEVERDVFLGCGHHERSAARRGYRNGYEGRHLGTSYGRLGLRAPRVRGTERPFRTRLWDAYQRRHRQVEAAVEAWVAAGCSTRAVVDVMTETFGHVVSPATVSRILAKIDAELAAWRSRPLERSYRVLWLDGKHGSLRKRGRNARKRGRKTKGVLLVAWGLRHDGREELVDFQAFEGEERYEVWEAFLTRLWERGVRPWNRWDEHLELIVTDGHLGLEAALAMVYPTTPVQRCRFHKVQNLADHLRDRTHRAALLASASEVWDGVQTAAEALGRLERWAETWRGLEPEAVANFLEGFDRTLTYLTVAPALRTRVGTTNPIERFLGEVEKATDHVPIWENACSWERHLWVLWKRLKHRSYRPTRPRPEFTRTS
jgi:transposase-like protein